MSVTPRVQSKTHRAYNLDGGTRDPATKAATGTDPKVKAAREEQREDLRTMDKEMTGTPGYSTAHVDSQRHMPGAKTAPLGHTRKNRRLPERGTVRTPVSGWQKRQRYAAALDAQAATPHSEQKEIHALLKDGREWQRVNDELSKHTGNVHEMSAADEKTTRRLDRTIQRGERRNDRGHVVYANVIIPSDQPTPGMYAKTLADGEVVDFDRYTVGAHNLHETEDEIVGDRMVTLEISTRRGRYYGGGERSDRTRHLLPRGLRLVVVGKEQVTYTRPDGSTGKRMVIQLADISDD